MVSVLITTFNSAPHLEPCLLSVLHQLHQPVEIVVVDNASTDGTRQILSRFRGRVSVILNEQNVGFAAAQNQAAAAAHGDWLFSLNPDVVLSPAFISQAVAFGGADPETGTICGKLLRWTPGKEA